mmetsp:Transcript_15041/g.34814  ORF Transcript_15041/g.34814 Transcript_15041/m.34814 type:complete len:83 (+) Transcript_15041:540-788(+)
MTPMALWRLERPGALSKHNHHHAIRAKQETLGTEPTEADDNAVSLIGPNDRPSISSPSNTRPEARQYQSKPRIGSNVIVSRD